MVYISYDVDTLYSWFGAFWRMLEHEINNNYETLIERYVCQSNEIWLVFDLWAGINGDNCIGIENDVYMYLAVQ